MSGYSGSAAAHLTTKRVYSGTSLTLTFHDAAGWFAGIVILHVLFRHRNNPKGKPLTRPVEKHMHCKSYDNDFSYGFFTGTVNFKKSYTSHGTKFTSKIQYLYENNLGIPIFSSKEPVHSCCCVVGFGFTSN